MTWHEQIVEAALQRERELKQDPTLGVVPPEVARAQDKVMRARRRRRRQAGCACRRPLRARRRRRR